MAKRFVIDCSVIMSWCFADETAAYAEAVLASLAENQSVAPALLVLEIANVLLSAEKKKRLRRPDTEYFIEQLGSLPIEIIADSEEWIWREVLPLARDTGLSSYDAAYLALAKREGIPLATLDAGLRKAAKGVGVSLYSA